MKNWFLPAALVGLSGLALVCASERGRERLHSLLDGLLEHGEALGEFNKFLDDQVSSLQRALDSLANALEEPHS